MQNNQDFMAYVQDLLRQAQTSGPDVVINMLSQRNPQAANDMRKLLQQGMTPQQAAMSVLQRMGINPANLTGRGFRR